MKVSSKNKKKMLKKICLLWIIVFLTGFAIGCGIRIHVNKLNNNVEQIEDEEVIKEVINDEETEEEKITQIVLSKEEPTDENCIFWINDEEKKIYIKKNGVFEIINKSYIISEEEPIDINLLWIKDDTVYYYNNDTSSWNEVTTDIIDSLNNEEVQTEANDTSSSNSSNLESSSPASSDYSSSSNSSTSSSDTKINLINSVALNPITTGYEDLDNKVSSILAGIGGSTYDRLKGVYDYLINNTYYGGGIYYEGDVAYLMNNYHFYRQDALYVLSAISLFDTGYGVCDNYAAAFLVLTRAIGLDSYVVEGQTSSSSGGMTSHAWNVININGTYYIFDAQVEDNITGRLGYNGYFRFFMTYEELPGKYIPNGIEPFNYFSKTS